MKHSEHLTLEERLREDRTRRSGQWTKIPEGPLKHKKKHFYSDGGQTLEQAARINCGVSALGDTSNPARHSPGPPALADPALKK